MPAPRCESCSSGIYDDSILLWDGKDYCRNCISRESLRLARFAAENLEHADTIPREAVQVRKFMAFLGPQYSLFVLVFFRVPPGMAALLRLAVSWRQRQLRIANERTAAAEMTPTRRGSAY